MAGQWSISWAKLIETCLSRVSPKMSNKLSMDWTPYRLDNWLEIVHPVWRERERESYLLSVEGRESVDSEGRENPIPV